MDLVMHISGKFAKGLVVPGIAVCIELLGPSGTLCYDFWLV